MRATPWHQTNWDARAAANFMCGGSGTGLLFFATLAAQDSYRITALIAMALVALGLTCVWLEIGRPLRALNVFLHPQTSWMTREGMAAPLMFAPGAVAVWQGGGTFAWVAAFFGLVFLYCQGRILLASKGIPTWREPKIMPLIISTGFVEGAGLAVLLAAILPGSPAPGWFAGTLLGALALRRLSWRWYFDALESQGAPKQALQVLRSFGGRFELLAQTMPEMMLVAVIFLFNDMTWLVPLAGLLAAAGGWGLKFTIVARAAFNQGFALPVLPVRGQGTAIPGVKPGWTK
ncbi:MAG: dimethyl sulfoxide reductase anchor subunit [Betaproteobacteria bacterium]|nr:dimethyl sulfoxide reductase anchor subunit [Betaproteobacteria bacterium]